MILRLLFPYILLMAIVLAYLYFRRSQLGPVVIKVNRALISRYNADSLLLIIVIAAASYFLGRYELQSMPAPDQVMLLGPLTYVYFYGALILVVIAREAERPALREKGISTSRGFWKWDEVETYRWSKEVLTINISRGRKKRAEVWQVNPSDKKEIDQVLKKMMPKRQARSKKKSK